MFQSPASIGTKTYTEWRNGFFGGICKNTLSQIFEYLEHYGLINVKKQYEKSAPEIFVVFPIKRNTKVESTSIVFKNKKNENKKKEKKKEKKKKEKKEKKKNKKDKKKQTDTDTSKSKKRKR